MPLVEEAAEKAAEETLEIKSIHSDEEIKIVCGIALAVHPPSTPPQFLAAFVANALKDGDEHLRADAYFKTLDFIYE